MALVTAPLGSRDTFPYRSLGSREIRLLIVKVHTHWPRKDTFSCSIKHIDIDKSTSSNPYVALSYTWGDGQGVTSLRLQDETTGKSGEITVTSSLMFALQTILEPGKRHAMWIDQICINQSSALEKGEQVQLMRWVYERAKIVHIWLGPASDDSDKAMMYLGDADTDSLLRDFSDSSRVQFTVELENAVRNLCARPYWTRTWTIQEATALRPQDTMVSCGHTSVYLTRFLHWEYATREVWKFPSNFILHGIIFEQGLTAVQRFKATREQSDTTLYDLITEIRNLTASDPRDKICSMLNFATDVLHEEIKPDYTKTIRQTYTEVVLWFINKYHCLDILGDCHPNLHGDAAPTWVPDWNILYMPHTFVKTSFQGRPDSHALYRAGGEDKIFVQQPVNIDTRLLLLSGVRISNLALVMNQVKTDGSTWAAQKSWQPTDLTTVCPLTNLPMHEVYRRTIYLDRQLVIQEATVWVWSRVNHIPLPWMMEDFDVTPQIAETIASTKSVTHVRCPFYTKPCAGSSQGLLGLSHETAKPGDELWILKGGRMPFILRPKPMTILSTDLQTGDARELPVVADMPTYELVGEAFVLGLMDGEVVDMLGATPKRERPPPLVDMDKDWRTIGLI